VTTAQPYEFSLVQVHRLCVLTVSKSMQAGAIKQMQVGMARCRMTPLARRIEIWDKLAEVDWKLWTVSILIGFTKSLNLEFQPASRR
jgi:hypothetical protein